MFLNLAREVINNHLARYQDVNQVSKIWMRELELPIIELEIIILLQISKLN